MNEKQKKLLKDIYKSIGLIGISLIVIYMLSSGSLNVYQTFMAADLMGKVFYILFTVVFAYNVGKTIRATVEVRKSGRIKAVPNQNPGEVNIPLNNANVGSQQHAVYQRPLQESDPFDKFYGELVGGFDTELDDKGQYMVKKLQNKVEEFNKRLDSDVDELEKQYEEMVTLKEYINKNVGDMHKEYKKLEDQMQLVRGMIRTKTMVRERIKQLREN